MGYSGEERGEWGIVGKKGREWGIVGKKERERVGDSGEERKGEREREWEIVGKKGIEWGRANGRTCVYEGRGGLPGISAWMVRM